MKAKDRVCIAFPHAGKVNTEFATNLIEINRKRTDRIDSIVGIGNISLLTRSRNVIVKNFLDETKAEWLLMMDTDQILSVEAFDKLINAANVTERPIVSALIFAAFWTDNDELRAVPVIYQDTENGPLPWDDYPDDQIVEIAAAGTGCLLIHRSILERIREEANENQGRDWAWFADGAINGRWFSEDLLFSRRIRALGIKIHAHTGAILPHRKEFWLDDRHHKPYHIKNS
jgi:hypothetical protein